MDILVLMTAAICHDLDHPGYNNTYVWDFFLGSPLKGVPSLRRNFQQFAFQQLSDGAANLDPPLPCIPSSLPTSLSPAGCSSQLLDFGQGPRPPLGWNLQDHQTLKAATVPLCQSRLGRCRAAAARPLPKVETAGLHIIFLQEASSSGCSQGHREGAG